MTQEKCDRQLLRDACHRIARTMLSATRPDDFARIQAVADSLYGTALYYEMCVLESGRDPNILVRCVEYLESSHAVPAMGDDTTWFPHRLEVVLDLVTPGPFDVLEDNSFLRDLRAALSVFRSNLVQDEEGQLQLEY